MAASEEARVNARPTRLWTSAAVWTLGLVLAAAAASLLPEPFVLGREALAQGEVWRLWTGHLVHHTTWHFVLDVGAGAVLLLFVRSRMAALLLPPVVGLGVLALRPDLGTYAGLSGVLHGWTVLAAVDLARTSRGFERWAATGLLVGVIAKSLFEALSTTSVFTSTVAMGGETVYTAHLVGALAGLVLAAVTGLSFTRAPQPATR